MKTLNIKRLMSASKMFGLGIDHKTGQPKFYRIASIKDRQVININSEGSSESVLSSIYQDED